MVVVKNYEPRGREGVFGAPLIEFHQVRIHPHQHIDQPLQIYGTIKVTNSVGRISYLYNQPEDDTETVYAGDIISLCDMHPVLLPFPVTTVYVKLVDKTNQLVLADDTLILDYTEKRMTFEEDGNVNAIGKDGFVNLRFTTFDVGVIAFFNFTLYKKNDLHQCRDDDDDDIDVLGTIWVSCESEYSFAEDFKIQLLRLEDEDDPLPVTFGESIPLSKSRMGVPAYSSIRITVSFRDIIDNLIIFPVKRPGACDEGEIKGFDDYIIKVGIDWVPGIPRKTIPRTDKLQTRQLIYDDSPPTTSSFIKREAGPCSIPEASILELTEVYSVDIIPDDKLCSIEDLNLYGCVEIVIPYRQYRLFEATKNAPISFRQGEEDKTITIGGPSDRYSADFWSNLQVDLRDIHGDLFCEGFVHWHICNVNYDMRFSWYDQRLCSVIKGNYGLVKIYHSIFRRAVQAKVTVLFNFDTKVSGSVIASYGKYAYDSLYDKDHYRNVLFSESGKSSCSIGCGQELPLRKSVISWPIDSTLVIDVDLCVENETFKLLEEFEFEMDVKYYWKIQKKEFFIEVIVEQVLVAAYRVIGFFH